MIIDLEDGEKGYYTIPPLSPRPVTIQIWDVDEWKNMYAIRYTGDTTRLYGPAQYRSVVGVNGPNCCVEYTETDLIEVTPEFKTPAMTTTPAP